MLWGLIKMTLLSVRHKKVVLVKSDDHYEAYIGGRLAAAASTADEAVRAAAETNGHTELTCELKWMSHRD